MQNTISLNIPIPVLFESVAQLSSEHKRILLEMLETELALQEEALWEQQPDSQAALQEARTAYTAGDYLTLEDYVAEREQEAA